MPYSGRMNETPRNASAQYQAPSASATAQAAWPANLAVAVSPRLRWLRILRMSSTKPTSPVATMVPITSSPLEVNRTRSPLTRWTPR